MKKLLIAAISLICLLAYSPAFAVGTVTETANKSKDLYHKIVLDWLSDAAGDATYTTTEFFTGEILRVSQVPDGGGTAPTTLYDVVVNDEDGQDTLLATGANVAVPGGADDTALTAGGAPLTTIVRTQLSLVVSNAGNAKGGLTIIYFRGEKSLR